MFTNEDPMSLNNLKEGAAVEMFDMELQKVLNDLVDPNKDRLATRSVTLTVTFKPDKHREDITPVYLDCNSKLAKQNSCATSAYIGRSGKTGHAREIMETQQQIQFPDSGKVVAGQFGDQGEQ